MRIPKVTYLLLFAFLLAPACPGQAGAPSSDFISQLPAGDAWLSHLKDQLMPYWRSETAYGDPFGAFPSTRCDDGTLFNTRTPCPEIGNNGWLRTIYDQRWLVAQSRQVYAYGVAFHVSGDPNYLVAMKAGVDFIRKNLVDRTNGGMVTSTDARGASLVKPEHRNPQELGYGLLGMSFYYYLTRDEDVFRDIAEIKNYIFANYYDGDLGVLKWMLKDNGADKADQKKLVAQLDQMNAYLVMLAPIVPDEWKEDFLLCLQNLSYIMQAHFWNESEGLFFTTANTPADLDLSKSGTDFGHTIKALWMMRNTGLLAGDMDLVQFAEEKGRKVLDRAFLEDSGSWASALVAGGAIDKNKSWWIYCELDQFASTVALSDVTFARYLPRSYEYWLKNFVDYQYGEVWNTVNGTTHQPDKSSPKAWPWKNGYHSMEHGLVAYITSQQLHGEPVTLYFAFKSKPADDKIRPYFYSGNIESITDWEDAKAGRVWEVVFRGVR